MSQIKMVAVDMDGTLLNNSSEISEKNQYAINELVRKGIKIIFATGRTFKSAQHYAKQINLDLPMITYNGALIKKILSEEELFSSKIDLEASKKLFRFAEKNNIYVKTYIDDVLYVAKDSEEASRFSIRHRIPYKVVGNFSENISERVYMIVSIDSAENINKLKQDFLQYETDSMSYTTSTTYSLEIMSSSISKGKSLEKLCSKMNIERNQVLAMGNSLNDLEMLKWAGVGIAMKNSDESLLSRHCLVSSHSNEEDGVYYQLKELGVI